jgi:hypothetical protein
MLKGRRKMPRSERAECGELHAHERHRHASVAAPNGGSARVLLELDHSV